MADKNELLFQKGLNLNKARSWQKRGVSLLWDDYDKPGRNPKTGGETTAQ